MRIKAISLKWFRGAAAEAILPLDGKSIVVFGTNGAGKSSFADGVEIALNRGKLTHLSHEYSGRYQEKGLINTSRPIGCNSSVQISFENGAVDTWTWVRGAATRSVIGNSDCHNWDYRRTVLRQEELSDFIRATKGEKYNAVVPLLGLSNLEAVAENLHKLSKTIDRKAGLQTLRSKIEYALEQRREVFGEETDAQLNACFDELRSTYTPTADNDASSKVAAEIVAAIGQKIATLDADSRAAAAIGEIGKSGLAAMIAGAKIAGDQANKVAEPLLRERLHVLKAADNYVKSWTEGDGKASCPACGQHVEMHDLQTHVFGELDRLAEVEKLYERQREIVSDICDEITRLRGVAQRVDLENWRSALGNDMKAALLHLQTLGVAELRSNCRLMDVPSLAIIIPLIARAKDDETKLSPQIRAIVDDQNKARTLESLLKIKSYRAIINRTDKLVLLTTKLEGQVQAEIADKARDIFKTISSDVQSFWRVLRPKDDITAVRLLVSVGNDKAIEVALRFHGHDQDSPRLTLSEGQRNALGLCIFLAMANKVKADDRPIILDDVVISLDREHRSRVATLLKESFAGRQVLLLTHDREWYFELQRVLAKPDWKFLKLLPYDEPKVGIAFDRHAFDFDTARARAKIAPEEALTNARRIMDVALSTIAEKIALPVPHLRGDENDHRTTGQFLVALERMMPKSSRKKSGADYIPNDHAIAALTKLKPEVESWANRGTHTFSGSVQEAEELLDDCETFLDSFQCTECKSLVSTVRLNSKKSECRCGILQWRIP